MGTTVEQALVSPRYLAGPGDPAWVTVPLHRAAGWSHANNPLTPRVILISPDRRTMLRLDPDPDDSWWIIQHKSSSGSYAWWATFDARTPVELIGAFTDALTDPAITDIHADPYKPLRQADWSAAQDGAPQSVQPHLRRKDTTTRARPTTKDDSLTSPDGFARVEHFTGSNSSTWFIETALSEDPEDLVWRAHFSEGTPSQLISAFTHALADPTPLRRDPARLHSFAEILEPPIHDVPAEDVTLALRNRIASLTRQRTASVEWLVAPVQGDTAPVQGPTVPVLGQATTLWPAAPRPRRPR